MCYQLLSVPQKIGEYLDKNMQTDIIYLDFAKTFDYADHNILLTKPRAYGVSGQVLNWLKNYLSGRVQRVVVDGAASQSAPVTSGVPQGNLLGPLLFTIFIYDLPNALEGMVKTALHADNTKIFNCIGLEEDSLALQATLSNMEH